ncbi:hypothetical protein PV11_07123 [Exophiala sideris]|uniref:FAD-binding domain-containing protein n=1 Tax=Exophiala sideris TaxID=1016849 RepID=A0A0D1WWP3_9EURO|nr:hypothetical protein PV11_07123 [Exophiala sideris]
MAKSPPPPQTCAIIGAGPAGLAAALALRKLTSIQPTIYEARPSPSTMGGAINLGANALDLLRFLGIDGAVIPGNRTNKMEIFSLRTGSKLGEMPFTAGPQGEPARRMLRADLQNVMLARAKQLDIDIRYSSRMASVHDSEADMQDPKSQGSPQVTITFTNSLTISADFVLGCDGIFSAVRRTYVQPDRHPIYTGSGSGAAAAYTVLPASKLPSTLPIHSIVAGTSIRGWSLMSYCDAAQTQIFAAVVLPLTPALPKPAKARPNRTGRSIELARTRTTTRGTSSTSSGHVLQTLNSTVCATSLPLKNWTRISTSTHYSNYPEREDGVEDGCCC